MKYNSRCWHGFNSQFTEPHYDPPESLTPHICGNWISKKSHSDQGSQFTSTEWQSFLSKHNLDASMSRRGNCHDNAVAESFFHLLKRERIRRRTYLTRDAARQDVFDYIEMFYNPTRKHTNNGMLSPVDYEMKQQRMNEAGV